jgi:hypothetical protein
MIGWNAPHVQYEACERRCRHVYAGQGLKIERVSGLLNGCTSEEPNRETAAMRLIMRWGTILTMYNKVRRGALLQAIGLPC